MSEDERTDHYFSESFDDAGCMWGLRQSMVRVDTFFREKVTFGDVIKHLRNALSHPTPSDPNIEEYPLDWF